MNNQRAIHAKKKKEILFSLFLSILITHFYNKIYLNRCLDAKRNKYLKGKIIILNFKCQQKMLLGCLRVNSLIDRRRMFVQISLFIGNLSAKVD